MRKLSDSACTSRSRDSSTRREEVSAAQTMRDASMAIARTNPATRSFMPVFIARARPDWTEYRREFQSTNCCMQEPGRGRAAWSIRLAA
jgi:hypothetical protein